MLPFYPAHTFYSFKFFFSGIRENATLSLLNKKSMQKSQGLAFYLSRSSNFFTLADLRP